MHTFHDMQRKPTILIQFHLYYRPFDTNKMIFNLMCGKYLKYLINCSDVLIGIQAVIII